VKLEIRNAGGREAMTIENSPLGNMLRLAIAPIGPNGTGVIVASARASGFPSEAQRLLLATAANETTLGLQRWRGETEMRRFVALVESSSDFVGYADLDGTTRYVNPAGMRLVGLDEYERVPPLHIMEFLVPEDRPRACNEAWPEAMPGMDRRELRLTTTLRPPDLVEFAVADSGPGVDAEAADRIFEPFVTTKRAAWE